MMNKSSTFLLCCLLYIIQAAVNIPQVNTAAVGDTSADFYKRQAVEVQESIYNLDVANRNLQGVILNIKNDIVDANKRFNTLENFVLEYHNAKVDIIQRCAVKQGVTNLSNEQAKKEIKYCEKRSNTNVDEINDAVADALRQATVVIAHSYSSKDKCLKNNKKDADQIECINNIIREIDEYTDKTKEEGVSDVKAIKHEVTNLNHCASEASETYRKQVQDSNVDLLECIKSQ